MYTWPESICNPSSDCTDQRMPWHGTKGFSLCIYSHQSIHPWNQWCRWFGGCNPLNPDYGMVADAGSARFDPDWEVSVVKQETTSTLQKKNERETSSIRSDCTERYTDWTYQILKQWDTSLMPNLGICCMEGGKHARERNTRQREQPAVLPLPLL